MMLRDDFVLRQVAATWVVLPLSRETVDFNGMIRLNDTGALLWQRLEQGSDREGLIRELTSRYAVSEIQAGEDVDAFLNVLRNAGCIEE